MVSPLKHPLLTAVDSLSKYFYSCVGGLPILIKFESLFRMPCVYSSYSITLGIEFCLY